MRDLITINTFMNKKFYFLENIIFLNYVIFLSIEIFSFADN